MHTTSGTIRWVRWLGALAVTLAALAVHATPATAIEDVMAPYEVQVIDGWVPDAAIRVPEDGRLRGYGFAADIKGVSTAIATVEIGFLNSRAPEGFKLVVFAFTYEVFGKREDAYPVRGTVVIDGRRVALDHPLAVSTDDDAITVAAAVPNDAKQVDFELASAGTAQTFSLTENRRVGFQPIVLYRDPASPDVMTDVHADRVVRMADDKATSEGALLVNSVRLSWFSPRNPVDIRMAEGDPTKRSSPVDPVTSPSSSRRAFLIVEGVGSGITPDDGPWFDDIDTLPEADVKVRLPDGTVVESKLPNPKDGGPLLGRHYFEVPADVTNFTLLVGPTTASAVRVEGDTRVPTTVRIDGASWDVTLPPGNPPVVSEDAASAPTTAPPRTAARERSAASDNSGLVALVVAILVVLAGAVFLGLRRRRPDREVEDAVEHAPQRGDDEPIGAFALATEGVLHLVGPGAVAAARAGVLSRAAQADVVVLARDEAEPLRNLDVTEPGRLTVAEDESELLAAIEVEHLGRVRDVSGNGSTGEEGSTGHRGLVVVVPGSIGPATRDRLDDALRRSRTDDGLVAYEMVLAVVGGEANESSIGVDAEGWATVGEGDVARRLAIAQDEPDASGTQPPSASTVSLRLLGTYRILVGDREVASGLRTKARELIALLAVHREGIHADAAIEALWPETQPDRDAYLRTLLGNVRAVLREASGLGEEAAVVERIGPRYRLDPELFEVDLWRFEDALATTGDAAEAYGGHLLEGEDFPWAESARERLRRQAIDRFVRQSETRRAADDLEAALRFAERAVECDPYAEELYQRVMAIHDELGRTDGVRRTYEAMAASLQEIGAEPGERSRALLLEPSGSREQNVGDA